LYDREAVACMRSEYVVMLEHGIVAGKRESIQTMVERYIMSRGGMIAEFDDLGRARAGRQLGRRDTIEVASLLAEAVELLQARPPQVTLAPDVRSSLAIQGDPQRLSQLFRILLGQQLARGAPAPVQARLEHAGGRLRM